jgi:GTP1/Obg family GTP-binding protein
MSQTVYKNVLTILNRSQDDPNRSDAIRKYLGIVDEIIDSAKSDIEVFTDLRKKLQAALDS